MIVIIRTDASARIGTGHLMRCIALAQALEEINSKVIFAFASQELALESRLASEGFRFVNFFLDPGSFEDVQALIALAQQMAAEWIILDGYHFNAKYQQKIKAAGLKLLVIDDYGQTDYFCADVILNQNLHACEHLYKNRESHTRLLLGSQYILIRKEFFQWSRWRRRIVPTAHKFLITLGGSDPDNVTFKVIQSLQYLVIRNLELTIVIGGSNPHREQLNLLCRDLTFPWRVKRNVTDMPALMAWADLAISGGGSTCWEIAFMGLPNLILVLAPNQSDVAAKLHEVGASINLGWHGDVPNKEIEQSVHQLSLSAQTREQMSHQGQALVDGYGSIRVAGVLQETQT